MNKLRVSAVSLALVLMLAACATWERASYFTYNGISIAVEQARQAYGKHVETCNCVTVSEFGKVESAYTNKYQPSMKVVGEIVIAYKDADTVPDSSAVRSALAIAAANAADLFALIERFLPPAEAAKLKTKVPKNAKIVLTKEGK